jgi:hypothetical protein
VRATFSTQYKDEQALAMLKAEVRPVHSHNPLVQISSPTLSPSESESMGHPELEGSRA